jgi:hypothetical protein
VPFVKTTHPLISGLAFVALTVLASCSSLDFNAINGMPDLPAVTKASRSEGSTAKAPDFMSYRIAAAKKIVQANRDHTFVGDLPESLASIPVLEVSLNADGSVRAIHVLRTPHFYPETIEMATQAVRRAAPFGAVDHLPKPWVFNETFLYNDALKFQLHSLQP